jgi:integrase
MTEATVKIKITKSVLDKLEAPTEGYRVVWDTELKGFGARVSHDRITFFLQKYSRAERRAIKITIGRFGEMTVDDARERVRKALIQVSDGVNPTRAARAEAEKRKQMITIDELSKQFLIRVLARRRRKTHHDYKLVIDKYIVDKLGTILVPELTQEKVAEFHENMEATPYQANRALAVLSAMMTFAGRRADNPCSGVERYQEPKRVRFLDDDELARFMAALDARTTEKISCNAIRLLLLTGARRGEVLAMRWDDIHEINGKGLWIKPGATTKQKTEHRVALSHGALQVLEAMKKYRKPGEPFVFPGHGPGEHLGGFKKTFAALCKEAKITNFRTHDLRHSAISFAVSNGVDLTTAGKVAGHTQAATTWRYSHIHDAAQIEAVAIIDRKVNGNSGAKAPTVAFRPGAGGALVAEFVNGTTLFPETRGKVRDALVALVDQLDRAAI